MATMLPAVPSSCIDQLQLPLATAQEILEVAELVVGGARPFGRNHQRAHGLVGRASFAEDFAFPRADDAFQDLAALARLGIGDLDVAHGEPALGVEARVLLADANAGVIDRSEAAPLEELCDRARDAQA